jgi:hypothetical protein
MTDLASSLHSWLDHLDSTNELAWYQHVVSRDLACGCKLPATYCDAWKAILNPPASRINSFWLYTEPDPITDAQIQAEAPRRKYVILNAREYPLIQKFKAVNPNCVVFCYKDLSSVRSYDTHTDVRMLPAGISYGYAKTMPQWQAQDSSGRWLEYGGYGGHWQMDVGQPGYQNAWATNVAKMKALGFDGIWMDNALWFRNTYHEDTPVRNYATDEAFREAYRSFFRAVCPRMKATGLLTVANMADARRIQGGWNSYLDAGLDGGFDEWWLTFNDDDLLSHYSEGWGRQVDEIVYTESKGKICLVQPHFTVGNTRAFRYVLASYLMGHGNRAAISEIQVRDGYDKPSPWHVEYDWNLGAPSGVHRSVGTNLFRRDFARGCVVVNANLTSTGPVTIQLGGTYLNEGGASVTSVSLPGTSGAILRRPS